MDHPTGNSTVCQWAQFYLACGLSVIPLKVGRAPALDSWKQYQTRRADDEQCRQWFEVLKLPGLGIVEGHVSDDLEVIDFDQLEAFHEFQRQLNPTIRDQLLVIKSPGGFHVYYRFRGSRSSTQSIKDSSGSELLSIRGEGSYVVAPGSLKLIYEKIAGGAEYKVLQGRYDQIPVLSANHRASILDLCRSMGKAATKADLPKVDQLPDIASFDGGTIPPGARHDYLLKAAWLLVRRIKHPTAMDFESVLTHLKPLNALCVDKKGRAAPRPDRELFSMVQSAFEKDYALRDEESGEDGQPIQMVDALFAPLSEIEDEPEPEFFWQALLARGWISLLVGQAKAGKSTLLAHLLSAFDSGDPFLGQFVNSEARAVVITEENASHWKKRVETCGIPADLRIQSIPFFGKPVWKQWSHYIESIAGQRGEIDLVIFDPWINFSPAMENDANEVARALMPIRSLTEAGLGVLLLHHSGRTTSHARGSTVMDGFADNILTLIRGDPNSPQHRRLKIQGRYPDTPDELSYYVDYEGRLRMSTEMETREKGVAAILKVVAGVDEAKAMSVREVAEGADLGRRYTQRILTSLVQRGDVARAKDGRGFRYYDPFGDPLA